MRVGFWLYGVFVEYTVGPYFVLIYILL